MLITVQRQKRPRRRFGAARGGGSGENPYYPANRALAGSRPNGQAQASASRGGEPPHGVPGPWPIG
jgi:hypothetical protein